MTIDMRAYLGSCTASTSMWAAQSRPRMSGHARQRAAQRNLATDAVRYIMTFGRDYRRTGVTFYVLRRRDIPREDLRLPWVARLEGAVALVSSDGEVITLYRGQAAMRAIPRKMKYRLPQSESRARWADSADKEEGLDADEHEESLEADEDEASPL